MKYAIDMGSGIMIIILIHTKLHKDVFRHSKVDVGGIHRVDGDCISLLLFLQNKESRLKLVS
jgi:ABC-type transporter Mla MlaB component